MILDWAIFHLRWGFITELDSLVENSKREEMLQPNIDFLSSMRIYAEEAMQQQEYLDKYYDSFMRSANRGYLTLVTIKYFEFGSLLMEKVSEGLTQTKLKNNLGASEKGKKSILNDNEILQSFLKASEDNEHLKSVDDRTKIFKLLVDKVVNARFSEEFRAYKEEYTVRGGKNKEHNLTLRGSLNSLGAKRKKKKIRRK